MIDGEDLLTVELTTNQFYVAKDLLVAILRKSDVVKELFQIHCNFLQVTNIMDGMRRTESRKSLASVFHSSNQSKDDSLYLWALALWRSSS